MFSYVLWWRWLPQPQTTTDHLRPASMAFPSPSPFLKREGPDASGVYSFEFETGNGIKREEQGAPRGPSGAVAMQGGWSSPFPDGSPADVTFVADDVVPRGVRPAAHAPPPPAHAIAQIEKARREDAAAAALSGRYSAPRTSYGYPQ
nr:cuticle protein AMP4-like [Penaeus vannamei]